MVSLRIGWGLSLKGEVGAGLCCPEDTRAGPRLCHTLPYRTLPQAWACTAPQAYWGWQALPDSEGTMGGLTQRTVGSV